MMMVIFLIFFKPYRTIGIYHIQLSAHLKTFSNYSNICKTFRNTVPLYLNKYIHVVWILFTVSTVRRAADSFAHL